MDGEELGRLLAGLVRVGTVTNVDVEKSMARVKFQSENMTSRWLHVLQHTGADVLVQPDGGHTHRISDTYTGGGAAEPVPDHDHAGSSLGRWMPKKNATVLCVYLPVFSADGFILGEIAQ